MLLASFPSPPFRSISVGPLDVYVYGLLIAIGVALGFNLARKRYEALGGDGDLVDRVLVWAVLVGFVGARLAYASTHLDRFEGRPLAILAIWEGGLALFGGLTVGTAVGIALVRRWGGDVARFADAVAPAIPLAQAIGRWGNYFNQELFGTPTDLPWAVEIDPANRPAAYADAATFHPTFLYESLYNLVVVAVLLRIDRRGRLKPGNLMLAYGILYGIGRFLLELIRTDTTFRLLGLSRNALVAIAVVVGSALVLRHRQRTAPDTTLLDQRAAEAEDEPEDEPEDEATETAGATGTTEADVDATPEADVADTDRAGAEQ